MQLAKFDCPQFRGHGVQCNLLVVLPWHSVMMWWLNKNINIFKDTLIYGHCRLVVSVSSSIQKHQMDAIPSFFSAFIYSCQKAAPYFSRANMIFPPGHIKGSQSIHLLHADDKSSLTMLSASFGASVISNGWNPSFRVVLKDEASPINHVWKNWGLTSVWGFLQIIWYHKGWNRKSQQMMHLLKWRKIRKCNNQLLLLAWLQKASKLRILLWVQVSHWLEWFAQWVIDLRMVTYGCKR